MQRMATDLSLSFLQNISVPRDIDYGGRHVFSVDVEEWFQVGAFERVIEKSDWDSLESRVERQTDSLLALLSAKGTTATFFCLGWVAKRHPALIRRLTAAGHEIACHGMDHRRLFTFTKQTFLTDVQDAKKLLEDTSGGPVTGYRAPSFSLRYDTDWAYDALQEAGFGYSSSVYPIRHDHYGIPDAPRVPFFPLGSATEIVEIPMTSYHGLGRNWPASGGGYFRLLPYFLGAGLFEKAVKANNAPGIFYMHPWEIDPGQPRVMQAPLLARFRHYVGQGRMAAKVSQLLASYDWGTARDVVLAPLRANAGGQL